MDAKTALELLKPLKKEEVITDRFTDHKNKCCAVGHLCRLTSNSPNNYSVSNCSDFWEDKHEINDFCRIKVKEFLMKKYRRSQLTLASVNNNSDLFGEGLDSIFPQDNPKDRVIALLEEMVEAGY